MKRYEKPLAWISVFLWMVLIFLLSGQTAPESGQLSNNFISSFLRIFPSMRAMSEIEFAEMALSLEFIVRKTAHATIYAILSLLVGFALTRHTLPSSKQIIFTLAICLAYAVSDEIHQYFVQGRSCELRDVLIDFSGSCIGCMAFFLLRRRFLSARRTKRTNRI